MHIHVYDTLEESFGLVGLVSKEITVSDIIKQTGRYSGLTLRVSELITPFTENWMKCRLILRRCAEPGWFIIEKVIEKNSCKSGEVSFNKFVFLLCSYRQSFFFLHSNGTEKKSNDQKLTQ